MRAEPPARQEAVLRQPPAPVLDREGPAFDGVVPPLDVAPLPEFAVEAEEERAARAIVKILVAAGVDMLGRELEKSIDEDWRPLFGPMLREAARFGRDELIEHALCDVFPEFPPRVIRIIRAVVSQVLDGRLSVHNMAAHVARDELIQALRQYDPELGDMTKAALFIHRLACSR